jgi:predicted signal transduction protein with EAL and GGDEF domain
MVAASKSSKHLRSFPVDKINRSFEKDLVERTDCVAIVDAISGLGRSLNT